MMSEAEIEVAAQNWRAAAKVLHDEPQEDSRWSEGLAEGYASALEMVLRG